MQERFEQAFRPVKEATSKGDVPGAAAIAGTATSRTDVAASGVTKVGGAAVVADTRFDLASLTKVVATLPAVLKLASEGELELDDRVGTFFSNAGWFQTPSLGEVTLKQLLTHSSGLPAWEPLFARVSERRTAVAYVLQSGLTGEPGRFVYSDFGFILLGAVVERVTGQRQDAFVENELFAPLGMRDTRYGPLELLPVAATEEDGWRGGVLEGVVHDENAFVMDGVAGHAGLFGTAGDLATYAQAWLRLDPRLGREEILLEAVREHVKDEGVRRGLGWSLKGVASFAGTGVSERGYGHTGFTGTSLWLEPERDSFSVLLTNRVHPSRSGGLAIHALRQAFHSGVANGDTAG